MYTSIQSKRNLCTVEPTQKEYTHHTFSTNMSANLHVRHVMSSPPVTAQQRSACTLRTALWCPSNICTLDCVATFHRIALPSRCPVTTKTLSAGRKFRQSSKIMNATVRPRDVRELNAVPVHTIFARHGCTSFECEYLLNVCACMPACNRSVQESLGCVCLHACLYVSRASISRLCVLASESRVRVCSHCVYTSSCHLL